MSTVPLILKKNFVDSTFNFKLEFKIDEKLDRKLKLINKDKQIFYHGEDKNKLTLLTFNRGGFFRALLVLSEEEFDNLFSQQKKEFDNLFSQQKGGSYSKKYLKYKQKYISLKKQLEN